MLFMVDGSFVLQKAIHFLLKVKLLRLKRVVGILQAKIMKSLNIYIKLFLYSFTVVII